MACVDVMLPEFTGRAGVPPAQQERKTQLKNKKNGQSVGVAYYFIN